MAKETKEKFLTYKGLPLVRNKDTIYYGNMYDDFVIKLQVKSKLKFKGLEVADKVSIQLLTTDPTANILERVVKKGEKNGLYEAIDVADAWLRKALV